MQSDSLKIKAIRIIKEKYPEFGSGQETIKQYRKIFINACQYNQLEILESISQIEKSPFILDLISFKNYEAFNEAIRNGHLPTFNKLIELTNGKIDQNQMIHFQEDRHFKSAAENGHLPIVNRIIELTPELEQLEQMIHAGNDSAFRYAAARGHLPLLNRLVELTSTKEKLEKMVHGSNDYAFRYAAANGHIKVIRRLIELTPCLKKLEQMIHAENDYAFQQAYKKGYFNIINLIMEIIGDIKTLNKMINHDDGAAFRYAILHNDLICVNKMIKITSIEEKQWEQLINKHFLQAAGKGHLNIVIRLIELTPDSKRLAMISSNNILGPCSVAYNGYLELSQYYLSFNPELKDTMVRVGPNKDFKQHIQDSDNFVQRLTALQKNNGEQFARKVFDCIKYARSVKDLALISKFFIRDSSASFVLEALVDYIGDQDVSLTRKEKVWVLNALASHAPNLEYTRNPQDKKVSFVERVLDKKTSIEAQLSLSMG